MFVLLNAPGLRRRLGKTNRKDKREEVQPEAAARSYLISEFIFPGQLHAVLV